MAKSKGSGDNKQGLVIALVFFVLTTIIAGVLAYFGYAEPEQFNAKAKKAAEGEKAARAELEKEQLKRSTLKIFMGVADDDDRKTFEGLKETQKDTLAETFSKAVAP